MGEFGCKTIIPRLLLLFLVALTLFHLLTNGSPISHPRFNSPTDQQHQSSSDDGTFTRHQHTGLGKGHLIIHDNNHGVDKFALKVGKVATWSREPITDRTLVIHDTNTAILLTNGHQIKLYPLREEDLTPSGGYYVIRSLEQFNLSDSKVIETLGPKSTFTHWLQYKQKHLNLNPSGNSTLNPIAKPSILPHESKRRAFGRGSLPVDVANDDDLFTSDNLTGWKRPQIAAVGYKFDSLFCESRGGDCLVVFWLDKANKYLRYGSYQFTAANSVQLLSSRFDTHGNLKSLSDTNKKTIWLHEFPPLNLRDFPREEDCEFSDLALHSDGNVIITCYIGANDSMSGSVSIDPPFVRLLHDTMVSILYDDGRKSKERKIVSNAVDRKGYQIKSNNELYCIDHTSHTVRLVEKMSNKPAIRMLDEIKLFRDTLFFNDLATHSIMFYNLTRRRDIRRQNDYLTTGANVKKKTIENIQRLESTHQVLLVEPSAIESFSFVNLNKDIVYPNGPMSSQKEHLDVMEPRVIDDNLSENITRQRVVIDCDDNMVHMIIQVILIVSVIILLIVSMICASRRNLMDKLEVAQYNEIQH